MSEGRVSGGWIQALLDGGKKWDKRQRAETDAQEVPPGHEDELFHCAGGCALDQVAQRSCGVSLGILKTCLDTFLSSVL